MCAVYASDKRIGQENELSDSEDELGPEGVERRRDVRSGKETREMREKEKERKSPSKNSAPSTPMKPEPEDASVVTPTATASVPPVEEGKQGDAPAADPPAPDAQWFAARPARIDLLPARRAVINCPPPTRSD